MFGCGLFLLVVVLVVLLQYKWERVSYLQGNLLPETDCRGDFALTPHGLYPRVSVTRSSALCVEIGAIRGNASCAKWTSGWWCASIIAGSVGAASAPRAACKSEKAEGTTFLPINILV